MSFGCGLLWQRWCGRVDGHHVCCCLVGGRLVLYARLIEVVEGGKFESPRTHLFRQPSHMRQGGLELNRSSEACVRGLPIFFRHRGFAFGDQYITERSADLVIQGKFAVECSRTQQRIKGGFRLFLGSLDPTSRHRLVDFALKLVHPLLVSWAVFGRQPPHLFGFCALALTSPRVRRISVVFGGPCTLLERGGLLEKTIRPAETIGKQKQAAKRDADAKQAAKEAAEAKAAAEAEAKAAAEAGDGDAAESTEA